MIYERIDESPRFDGPVRDSHELRYRLAAGFVVPGDTVLDACCGSGYGRRFLDDRAEYIGIDRDAPVDDDYDFRRADFETGAGLPTEPFDVFVGLEAIEHLNDAGVVRFVDLAHQARRVIVISTPIVPNKNRFHKQQFTERRILELFKTDGWRHFGTLYQLGIYGLFVFVRWQT